MKNCILHYVCSASRRMDADLERSALIGIARLKNSLTKGLKIMVTKVQWLCWKKEWAASKNRETCFGRLFIKYTTIGLRISGYGAAEVVINFTEELRHAKTNPTCKIHESRRTSCWRSRPKSIAWNDLPRVILISVTPMLQNLRIGLRKRRNGKSDVPVKQRGCWLEAS